MLYIQYFIVFFCFFLKTCCMVGLVQFCVCVCVNLSEFEPLCSLRCAYFLLPSLFSGSTFSLKDHTVNEEDTSTVSCMQALHLLSMSALVWMACQCKRHLICLGDPGPILRLARELYSLSVYGFSLDLCGYNTINTSTTASWPAAVTLAL